jgi:uncharacterized membrane protein
MHDAPADRLQGEKPMDPNTGTAATVPTSPARAPGSPSWPRVARSLTAGRGVAWWSEGWRVFTASPALWIGVVVTMVVIAILLNFIPFLGAIAQALLWPVFIGGLLLGCHALAQGRPLEFSHLFAGFQQGRTGPLVILGVLGLIVGIVFATLIMMLVFGAMGFSGMAGFLTGDPSAAMTSAMAGMGVAALLAVPVAVIAYIVFIMAWWFAPALVALNGADAIEAIKASFGASWKNIGALIVFLLLLLVLAIIATIPFGLGWLVLMPVMFGAMYASWREVFGE